MHGMNVRIQIQPGKVEEAAKLLREEVMPTAASYRGFIQNFLIVDAPNNRIASLSVWETGTDAKAIYEDEGGEYQTAIAKLEPNSGRSSRRMDGTAHSRIQVGPTGHCWRNLLYHSSRHRNNQTDSSPPSIHTIVSSLANLRTRLPLRDRPCGRRQWPISAVRRVGLLP